MDNWIHLQMQLYVIETVEAEKSFVEIFYVHQSNQPNP